MLSAFIGNKMSVHINSPGGYCLRGCHLSGGSRTRTCDLLGYEPNELPLLHPAIFLFCECKVSRFFHSMQIYAREKC